VGGMTTTDRFNPTILACRRAGLPVIDEHDCTCQLVGRLVVLTGLDGLRLLWPCDRRCPVHGPRDREQARPAGEARQRRARSRAASPGLADATARRTMSGVVPEQARELYLNPPERAVVLCVDEKSQIQALDRTQPILPMLPGTPERATHDYKRHGPSSLYAALALATGR
jgi:hypothetical protein